MPVVQARTTIQVVPPFRERTPVTGSRCISGRLGSLHNAELKKPEHDAAVHGFTQGKLPHRDPASLFSNISTSLGC